MKMSPWRSQGVLQAGVAVVERDAPVERLVEMDFGSGKAEALPLLGDLEALALPLHDVVVADHALVDEATDAVEIFRGRPPGGLQVARAAGEAAVVVGDEASQHERWRSPDRSLGQTEFAGEAILQHAPEAFDAAFGLRAAGGDEGDAELFAGRGRTEWAGVFQRVVLRPTRSRRCGRRCRCDRRRRRGACRGGAAVGGAE